MNASAQERLRDVEARYAEAVAAWRARSAEWRVAWIASYWRVIGETAREGRSVDLVEYAEPAEVADRVAEGWRVRGKAADVAVQATTVEDPRLDGGGTAHLTPRVRVTAEIPPTDLDAWHDRIDAHLARAATYACPGPSITVLACYCSAIGHLREEAAAEAAGLAGRVPSAASLGRVDG